MFITIEGVEGSGKSLLQTWLSARLKQQGLEVVLTREPGGSSLGKGIRPLLLEAGQDIVALSELFLFQADRAQHVAEVIRPALAAGVWVICDRYIDSTVAYQAHGRGLSLKTIQYLNTLATDNLLPDLTILLDLDPAIGLDRAVSRNAQLGLTRTEGRFEAETLAFHTRVRQGFLDLAQREMRRFVRIDASQPLEKVRTRAWESVAERWRG